MSDQSTKAQENAAFTERAKSTAMLLVFLTACHVPAVVECVRSIRNPKRNFWGSYD